MYNNKIRLCYDGLWTVDLCLNAAALTSHLYFCPTLPPLPTPQPKNQLMLHKQALVIPLRAWRQPIQFLRIHSSQKFIAFQLLLPSQSENPDDFPFQVIAVVALLYYHWEDELYKCWAILEIIHFPFISNLIGTVWAIKQVIEDTSRLKSAAIVKRLKNAWHKSVNGKNLIVWQKNSKIYLQIQEKYFKVYVKLSSKNFTKSYSVVTRQMAIHGVTTNMIHKFMAQCV